MLADVNLEKVLVFDIETVPQVKNYTALDTVIKESWERKCQYLIKDESPPDEFYAERAGIYAEFGKIICISAGFYLRKPDGKGFSMRVRSWKGDDEEKLLTDFAATINEHFNDREQYRLAGHNCLEFDIPYVCRRMVVHGIKLPKLFDLHGAKPWEVQHLDTMQLWKFGDRKSYTSLELLSSILKVESPKQDIKGSDVARVYYEEDGLSRISAYCQRDVLATAQVLLRFIGLPAIIENDVVFVD